MTADGPLTDTRRGGGTGHSPHGVLTSREVATIQQRASLAQVTTHGTHRDPVHAARGSSLTTEFYRHARSDVLRLCAHVRGLEQRIAELEGAS